VSNKLNFFTRVIHLSTIYRGMNQASLDAAYNNTQAIADFPEVLKRFQVRSLNLYKQAACLRDINYGEKDRERFDWISCGNSNAPTFIFIHGGYWQNCSKEDFAFVAEGPLALGFNVVLAEYTLAPEASLTQIVAEIHRLLDYLKDDTAGLGIANSNVFLCGHSAGGHLTAIHRVHPLVSCAIAISSLVDLEPISLSWLNEKLRLSSSEINTFSPLYHVAKGAHTVVAVGENELPELVRQSKEYAAACWVAGESAEYLVVPGCNHFSVLEDLSMANGVLMNSINKLKEKFSE
jgi:arylformamidase